MNVSDPKWRAACHAAAVLALAAAGGRAGAGVITFEGVAPPGEAYNLGPFASYIEGGFRFTPADNRAAVFDSASPTGASGNGTDFLGFAGGNTVTLAGGGGLFDLAGLDVGRTSLAAAPSVTVTVTGFSAGGGAVVATFPGLTAFTPVTLNWTNLTQVTFCSTDGTGIDNVDVSPVVPPSSTVTFEGFAPPGGAVSVGPFAPYTEGEFRLTPTNFDSAVFHSAAGAGGNGTDFFGFSEFNPVTLTRAGGGPFDLAGLDVGRLRFAGAPSVTLTVTGFRAGGGAVVATFPGVTDFTPVALKWTDQTHVQVTATDDAGIDNLRTGLAAPVPEPASLGLLAAGAAAVWYARRPRRAA